MSDGATASLHGVTPYLTVRGAKQAAEFCNRAFGTEEVACTEAEDGARLLRCQLEINGGGAPARWWKAGPALLGVFIDGPTGGLSVQIEKLGLRKTRGDSVFYHTVPIKKS